jgi:hypothetical protein
MSQQVTGYVVRAYLSSGAVEEHKFPGTSIETISRAQDKERELLDQQAAGADINAVYLGATFADMPSPAPSQATRHRREIAS